MGRAGPVAGLLPVRGVGHAVAEGGKALSLAIRAARVEEIFD